MMNHEMKQLFFRLELSYKLFLNHNKIRQLFLDHTEIRQLFMQGKIILKKTNI